MSADATNPKDLLGAKKPPMHLVPSALALWVSRVFGFSAKKYGPNNWRSKKVIRSIYIDAMDRHLQQLKDGEDFDGESGLPHVAHIAANCAIILDATALGQMVNDMKWQGGPASVLIEKLTEKNEKKPAPPTPALPSPLPNKHGVLVLCPAVRRSAVWDWRLVPANCWECRDLDELQCFFPVLF